MYKKFSPLFWHSAKPSAALVYTTLALALLFLVAMHAVGQEAESSRPTFLFPTAESASQTSQQDARRDAVRREGETALTMHAPDLAAEKFTVYCELTPANLPEGGTARRLLAEAQLALAETLLAQKRSQEATQKFHEALQTAEYYLVLPDIHPTEDDRDRLDLLRAHALLRLDRTDDALKVLLDEGRALTSRAHENPIHWEALLLTARTQLARREWTAALSLLTPFFDQALPQRKDAELLLIRADAELGRADYPAAAAHYAELLTLLQQATPPPAAEMAGLDTIASLRRLRALVGAASALPQEKRTAPLVEATELYRRLASQSPASRNVEWGTAVWCLANELARIATPEESATAISLLQEAFSLLPYEDPHWEETGMLLAQLLRQNAPQQAKEILEELRHRRPDSSKYGEFSLQLAEYRKEDNDRSRAAEIFDELSKRDDLDTVQRARAAFGAAECLALEGHIDQALNYYRKAAEHAEPRQAVTALLHAAQAAKNAGNQNTAIALLTETADRFGKLPPADQEENDETRKTRLRAAEARLDAALLLQQDGQATGLQNAILLLQQFQQDAPDSPRRDEARLDQSLVQRNLAGNAPEKLASAEAALRQLATEPVVEERLRTIAYFEWARSALQRGDDALAALALTEFLTAFPQSPYALRAAHRRVLLSIQTNRPDEARKQTAELLEQWPGTAEAAQLTLLAADDALAKSPTPDFLEALRLYRLVRPPVYSTQAEIAQARFETANCLYLMAQMPHLEQFINTSPSESTPSAETSPALSQKEAKASLVAQALSELAPLLNDPPPALAAKAEMLYGDLLAMAEQPSEARNHFRRTRELAGENDLGLAALGRLAEMQIAEAGSATTTEAAEKLKEALQTLEYLFTATQNNDLLALAHFRTAQCLRELGQHTKAAKNYEDAIRHYKEICVDYESSPETRSPRYYTLAVFELADLAEEINDPIFLEQAAQFLATYAQHETFPFVQKARDRATALHQRAQR